MRDNYHGNFTTPAFDYLALSHDATGYTIDLRDYDSCLFILHVGTVQNANANHYFIMSLFAGNLSDMSDEVIVTASNGLLGENLVLDSESYAQSTATLGYVGGKRYLRMKAIEQVITGTAQVHLSAVAVLDHGALQPLNIVGLI